MASDGRIFEVLDGNEAVARIGYALSEVIAIYPITPASPMGELADLWAARDKPNHFGDTPHVVQMQSEAGAAGTLHGALQRGALATTFTASQGLLLMLPNMFKIAGELTPAVIHVAARSVATHALSIFGDHSDVMAVRMSGFAMLSSGSVQEAHDMALVAHAASLEGRVPFLHFFDGFRTSHELNRIELLDSSDITALVDERWVHAHRARGLSPDRPVIRGTAQNPDVFFQSREAASPFHEHLPGIVQNAMDRLGDRTGRQYRLVDYVGAPDAERVMVVMGSAAGAAEEAVDALVRAGERVGLLKVRLFRPFPSRALALALPPTTKTVAVLDRTKEPGAPAEPLFQDVATAVAEANEGAHRVPYLVGGRYGLSSKEFTPQMVKAVFDELSRPEPRRRLTVGIDDDVSGTGLRADSTFSIPRRGLQALLFGLGSDGTVSAAKAAVKLVGDRGGEYVQGYAVYDSKKSGQVTVSHLRFSPDPIRSTYLIDEADVVTCHAFNMLGLLDVGRSARQGGKLLLDSPFGPDDVWDQLPRRLQDQIIEKQLSVYVVDAHRIAREAGLGEKVNWVLLPCFFSVSGLLPAGDVMAEIESVIRSQYSHRSREIVDGNIAAARRGLDDLACATVGAARSEQRDASLLSGEGVPVFLRSVTARLLSGEGDYVPVSALPVDGTYPSGTARYEKRGISAELPAWDPDLCIDCGKCAVVCPHAAIRMKAYDPADREGAPDGFLSKAFRSRDLPGRLLSIQVAPDDCTGCAICVDVCPATSKITPGHRALAMVPAAGRRDAERERWDFFLTIPEIDRSIVPLETVKTNQLLQPLFEFSGACAGCGETPYLKLLSQLFGDRILVANATGCSSIFGGNLPTTPWSTDAAGRGPAWSNSLFEDNAEFGLGMRLALNQQEAEAARLLDELGPSVGVELVAAIKSSPQATEKEIAEQRVRVGVLRQRLVGLNGSPAAARLLSLLDTLVRKSVWIVGGDGWAYDIGFGGLDHVLASGDDVNVLVLDTEVYSNTGGQASKATPRGAVAKFAANGKVTAKKDLGLLAMAYPNVYVASIALGANDRQASKVFLEAEAWPGPSLIIAYATCIEHGVDMATSMSHQRDAVKSGYWPLFRRHPGTAEDAPVLRLDSHDPSLPLDDFELAEERFAKLARRDPDGAENLRRLGSADVDARWSLYRRLSEIEPSQPTPAAP